MKVEKYFANRELISKIYKYIQEIKARLVLKKKIEGLDGLRFVAIASVILSHLGEVVDGRGLIGIFAGIGREGVSLSFTISGFIITYIILKEKQHTGTISFKSFYMKRFIKIFPVLYMYLFALYVLNSTLHLGLTTNNLFSVLLFYRNYSLAGYNEFTGHLWSLSVEEHFYLIFPIVVLLLNRQNLTRLCFTVFVLAPFFRILTLLFMPAFKINQDIMTHCRLDVFLGGVLIACYFDEIKKIVSSKIKNPDILLMILFCILYVFVPYSRKHPFFKGYWLLFGMSFSVVLSMFIVALVINLKDTYLYRLLNSNVFIHFGVISYSLYMWQEFAVYYFKSPLISIITAYVFALLSFVIVEMTFEKLRKRVV